MTTRARARAAMRNMAADAQGPRLRSRWLRIPAGRLTHVCLRTVEFAAALFIVGGLALASLLARGPLRLVGMHDQIQTSLQERVGGRLRDRSRTHLPHAQFVGRRARFQRLHGARRRRSTVPSAAASKLGLDPFTLPFLDVRVSRLELDGTGSAPARRCGRRAHACGRQQFGRDPNPSGRRERLRTETAPGSPPSSAPQRKPWPARTQALDRLTLANGHFEIDNVATSVPSSIGISPSHSIIRARGRTPGSRRPARRDRGRSPPRPPTRSNSLSLQGHDLSLADLQAFDKAPPPLTAEGPIAFKLDAKLTPGVGAGSVCRTVHASAQDACASITPTPSRFSSTRRAAPWRGTRTRGGFASTDFRSWPD